MQPNLNVRNIPRCGRPDALESKIADRMECPICDLENPPTAEKCDCGYNFTTCEPGRPATRTVTTVTSKPKSDRVLAGSIVLGVIGFFVLYGAYVLRDQPGTPPVQQVQRQVDAGPTQPSGPKLALLGWSWGIEHGYAIVNGQVENISEQRLERVQAVVTFTTKDDDFITSDTGLLEYDPILPGQKSPFKVMARANPAMQKAVIDFKFLGGRSMPWENREKKKKK